MNDLQASESTGMEAYRNELRRRRRLCANMHRRLPRAFAVAATVLMLVVIADPSVTKLALADPIPPPEINSDGGNETGPPPPLPQDPPVELPQREVEPGTVVQAWKEDDNLSRIGDNVQPTLTEDNSGLRYGTGYGNFFVIKDAPYYVSVTRWSDGAGDSGAADSAFTVLRGGVPWGELLVPVNGKIGRASEGRLEVGYDLLSNDSSLVGSMTVTYEFYTEKNKITASFEPSSGKPEDYQVIWLTFTKFDYIDALDLTTTEPKFEDLNGLHGFIQIQPGFEVLSRVGYDPFTTVKPEAGADREQESSGVHINAEDAGNSFVGMYAGRFTFGNRTDNAVLTVFKAGELTIDPYFLYGNQPQDATAFFMQRKTFFAEDRYWLFWKDSTTTVVYRSSVDGRTWTPPLARTAVTATSFPHGFTVINHGSTVAVLWTDSADSTKVHIRTGMITQDTVLWDDPGTTGRQLTGENTIRGPVIATFTDSGPELGLSWTEDAFLGWEVGFQRFRCTATVFSPCATVVADFFEGNQAPDYLPGTASTVAAFPGTSAILRWRRANDGAGYVKVYGASGVICGDVQLTEGGGASTYLAQPAGQKIYLFVAGPGGVSYIPVDIGCGSNSVQWGSVTDVANANDPSVATDDHGIMHLFYWVPSGGRYARIVPSETTATSFPIFAGYSPRYITVAESASHYVPLAFMQEAPTNCVTSYCLYYSNYPLPLDGDASTANPWTTKLGAPFIDDVGGVIGPTTGLLANGQTLVAGSPAIGLIYREPGLFNTDGTKFATESAAYQIIPGIYYDLPRIAPSASSAANAGGVLYMTGGQRYPLGLTGLTYGSSGETTSWFNITQGIRYTVKKTFDNTVPYAFPNEWTVTLPSGAYMTFDANLGTGNGNLTKVYLDTTGQNYVTYTTIPGAGLSFTGTVQDSSLRTISFSSSSGITSYGNGQTITFTPTLGGWAAQGSLPACSGIASDSGKLQVLDAIGRTTTYWVCKWKLVRLESPNGGRVDYAYPSEPGTPGCPNPPTPIPTCPVWQGTEAYSYPLTKMDIYSDNKGEIKARSQVFNWVFQNGEAVRALVNTTDKSAVVQGSTEYVFNPTMGTASVRVYDSTGQIAYYDMQALNGANMKDLSGNANDGTIVGTTSFYAGKQGKARDFNGVGDNIQKLSLSAPPTNGLTLAAWVNPDTTPAGTARILEFGDWAGSGTALLYRDGSGYPVFGLGPSTQIWANSASSTGTWTFVAGTWDGLTLRLYVNAVQQTQTANLATVLTATKLTVAGQSVRFDGKLDEVRVFARALSAEDINSLYTKNSIKKGEQQNWYSINGMPHLSEGFVGDETSASVVTQDAIDDWGNQIYSRDALGNETFSSFANTNHQNHFYAPSRLTKDLSTQFDTEFIDFSEGTFPPGQGTWTVDSSAATPTQLDYSVFDKITPSLKLNAASSGTATKLVHSITTGPNFVEFRARTSSTVEDFDIELGTTSLTYLGVRFSSDVSKIKVWEGAWVACTWPSGTVTYVVDTWYRFTIEVDTDTAGRPWRLTMNGVDLSCGTLTSDSAPTHLVFEMTLGTWSAQVDDIKIYKNRCLSPCSGFGALGLGISGLGVRQTMELVADDGSIIDKQAQGVTPGVVQWFTFNSLSTLRHDENGHNAKSRIRIYAEDGTLEYESPLTRFFVGEHYAYTRPRAFADEVVKTRSGALFWPSTIYADDACGGIDCLGSWEWKSSPAVRGAMRGTKVHADPFASFPVAEGYRWHALTFPHFDATSVYFVNHVRIPEGKTPEGIQFLVADYFDGFCPGEGSCWHQAHWGVPAPANQPPQPVGTFASSVYMGPVPAVRDQWIQLMVKTSDFGGVTFVGGVGFGTSGGETEWDVTTTVSIAQLEVTGLSKIASSGLTVALWDMEKNSVIASGTQSEDTAVIQLYDLAQKRTDFPIKANIKIFNTANEYYFGPLRDIWPGDSFRYVGASSFFDPKESSTAYWPASTIHTAPLGSKAFLGDCLDAVLCYDMETRWEELTYLDSGLVSARELDLSGKNNHGYAPAGTEYAPYLSNIAHAAAGLGGYFDGLSLITVQDSGTLDYAATLTVSAWIKTDGLSGTARIVEKGRGQAGQHWEYGLFRSGSQVCATIWQPNGVDHANACGGTLTTIRPYQVAFTWKAGSGGALKLFVDGVSVASDTTFVGTPSGGPHRLKIGARETLVLGIPVYVEHFWGTIDQVIIFQKMLNDNEIRGLYHSRLPGARQVFIRTGGATTGAQTFGFPINTRVPYEGTYLYAKATYDNKGNRLSITDLGRTISGGQNTTNFAYSTLYSGDYLTQVTRPWVSGDTGSPNGRPVYYAYDFFSGVRYGTLDIDCRRTRIAYDTMGRPTLSSVFDVDSSEKLHLDMETAVGGVFKDVSCAGTSDSRTAQSLTFISSPTFAKSISQEGQATKFTRIQTGIGTTATGTVSLWARPDALADYIVPLGIKNSAATRYFVIDIDNLDRWRVAINTDGSESQLLGSSPIIASTARFDHLALTWDETTNTFKFFVNGILVDSSTTITDNPTALTDTWVVGAARSGHNYFDGPIDEARILNRVLTQQEIQDIRDGSFKRLTSSSVAYDDMTTFPQFYGLPGTSVTSYDGVSTPRSLFFDMETVKATLNSVDYLEDLSGNGQHGQVNAGVTLEVSGKVGTAAQFPGTSTGDISTSTTKFVFPTKAFSVAFWANLTTLPASNTYFFGATSPNPSFDAVYAYQNAGVFKCRLVNTAGATFTTPAVTLTVSTWNHIACTFDGSTFRLYVNGVEQGTGIAFSGTSIGADPDFEIGGFVTLTGITGIIDEFHVIPRALSASEISRLHSGYSAISTVMKFPGANNAGADYCYPSDGGDWVNPNNAHADDTLYATAALASGQSVCNQWYAFFIGTIPANMQVESVHLLVRAYRTSNVADITVAVWGQLQNCGFIRPGVIEATFELDITACKTSWTQADLDALAVNVGAWYAGSFGTATIYLDYVRIQITFSTAPGGAIDATHVSTTYTDGLGRAIRATTRDIYGRKIEASATIGWNDQTLLSYTPSGGYFTNTYDFVGRTLTVLSPGDPTISGLSRSIVSDKARVIESIDAVGRMAYAKSDLLGRTIETAVWNTATGAYNNLTKTMYNALSQVNWSKDAKGQITTIYYNSLGLPKMTVFPDGTHSLAHYDDNLRAYKTVDVMGTQSTLTYNSLGRVTARTVGSLSFTYIYDLHDDLTEINNVVAKNVMTYDSLHRLKTERLDVPASSPTFSGTISYDYDKAGKILNITYPGTPICASPPCKAAYIYDSFGRATQVDYGGTKYAVLTYDSFGRLDIIHYWKGGTDTTIREKYSYDARDRIVQVKVFNGASMTYMKLDYTYNKASEIVGSTDNMYVSDAGSNGVSNPKTITYTYDGNGRLAKAVGPFGASQATEYDCYDYDAVGNIWHWGKGTASCPTSGSTYYTYNPTSWNQLASITNLVTSFAYNTAGSMTCKNEGGYTRYVHDGVQQLTQVLTAATSCAAGGTAHDYSYDGLGRRVKTVSGGTTSYFMYVGGKMLYGKDATLGPQTVFVYAGDKLLLKQTGSEDARYYHHDLSSNVRMTTYYTTSVQIDAKYRYKPFGEMLTLKSPVSEPRFKFAQQDYDGDTIRLNHMGARYHDPKVGRFIQRDPIGSDYSYANSNPISFSDPTGMYSEWKNFWGRVGAVMSHPTVNLFVTILSVAPIGGPMGLTAKVILLGLALGAIAVAATFVLSGGHATMLEYVAAFSIGFVAGTVIGSLKFGVMKGAATLGPAKSGLSGVTHEAEIAGSAIRSSGRLAGETPTSSLAEWRLTAREIRDVRSYMEARGLSTQAWVRYGQGEDLLPYVAARQGAFEVNRVPGMGYITRISPGGRLSYEIDAGITVMRGQGAGTISVFEAGVRAQMETLGITWRQSLELTLMHERLHALGALRGIAILENEAFVESFARRMLFP